ncbi:esterase/lipase [Thiogranum longum]|uniref:Esterase/lipase n=1 Tax=Thiogranum longum TaxID=1537524 RepID=A0A4R1HMH1_9GAMM|nr:alpha/beta fold hydrolase [Thiogranum longum]TCK18442.1 esterase/lipase [Thiogranum longum]
MTYLRSIAGLFGSTSELSERHRVKTPGYEWMQGVETLDDYFRICRERVVFSRTDLKTERREHIIDGNSPFQLSPANSQGASRTILMTHGLTDSPFLMRDIGAWFQSQGFRVLSMQLPGHGTRPGDLLDVRWQDWARAQRRLIDMLAEESDELYLLGFSLGAVLSLYQALHTPRFSALFLFSPAIRITSLVRAACPLAVAGRWWQRAAWFDVQPDTDSFKYESLTNRAICEVYRLTEAQRRLAAITGLKTPLFVAASENDATIDSPAVIDWFARQQSAHKRMLYYSTGQPGVPDGVRVINARHPEQRIRSYSHTALLQSPENPHYGEEGTLRFCTHYYRLDPEKYRRCKAGEEDCIGEMFDESEDCKVIRRLTWNPGYTEMLEEIRQFLDQLKQDDLISHNGRNT